MKNYLTPSASYLASLMIVLMLSWSCGTKELEFESPYQEVEDLFDEVGDLPEVEDADPQITEPEYQEMSTPPLVSNLKEQILAYGEEDKSISESGLKDLDRLKQGLERLGVNLDDPAKFESDYLAGIMESDTPMDEEFEALMDNFMGKYGLDAPLPVIPEVTEIPLLESLRISMNNGNASGSNDPVFPGFDGPCYDRARDAYERRKDKLEDQYNKSVDRINDNYQRRKEAAKKRRDSRNKEVEKSYKETLKISQGLISKILGMANNGGKKGNKKLDKNLKAFSLIFAYHIRKQLCDWRLSSLAFNKKAYNEEVEKIERQRDERLAHALELYEKLCELAKRQLEKAFDRCHNQGKGN